MKSVSYKNKELIKNSEVLNRVKELNPFNNPKYKRDDAGNGRLFFDVFGDICRFNTTKNQYSYYDGIKWNDDSGGMIAEKLAKKLADALYIYAGNTDRDYQGYVIKLGDRRKRTIMLQDARDFGFFNDEMMDSDGYKLNVLNGTLDLKTFEFTEHNPDDLLSKVANVEYNPDAESDDWNNFISEVMQGDNEKIDYLQRILGYALIGDCSQEEFYMFYGITTRNGKTTMLKSIGHVLGDYGQNLLPDALAQKQRNNPNNEDIASLKGKRFVHVEEISKQMALDSALVKNLTGNAPITTSRKYEHQVTFEPQFKIYIATNYLPTVTDDTLFSSERVKVITFDRHFEPDEQDTGLKNRLKSKLNASVIFNWLLDGLRKYYERGTVPPQVIRDASASYRDESDKLGNFIRECMIEDSKSCITANEAYTSYSQWCRTYGYYCENKKNFFSGLKRKKLLSQSGTVNGVTKRNVIIGYKLDVTVDSNYVETPF